MSAKIALPRWATIRDGKSPVIRVQTDGDEHLGILLPFNANHMQSQQLFAKDQVAFVALAFKDFEANWIDKPIADFNYEHVNPFIPRPHRDALLNTTHEESHYFYVDGELAAVISITHLIPPRSIPDATISYHRTWHVLRPDLIQPVIS